MKLWLTVLFMLPAVFAFPQFQLGFFCGVSDYNGDVLDKLYRFSRPASGPSVGYQFSHQLSMRLSATFGKLEGADSVSGSEGLIRRNLSFQSRISELALVVEYNLRHAERIRWTPFAFTGLAVYHYNPYSYNQKGEKIYLQPLGTEGQGLPQYPNRKLYALTRFALPMGGGLKFFLTEQLVLAAQIGLRITNNDYLDDVSTTYPDIEVLRTARGLQSVELSYRERTPGSVDPVYPQSGANRGRSGKLIFTDYYYFSGLHLIYRFSDGTDAAFNGRWWNRRRLRCASF
jgi:hypothetical protein